MKVKFRFLFSKKYFTGKYFQLSLTFLILSVFCGTWNVNGVNPPDLLKKWFDKVEIEDKKRKTPPDIIVIG